MPHLSAAGPVPDMCPLQNALQSLLNHISGDVGQTFLAPFHPLYSATFSSSLHLESMLAFVFHFPPLKFLLSNCSYNIQEILQFQIEVKGKLKLTNLVSSGGGINFSN